MQQTMSKAATKTENKKEKETLSSSKNIAETVVNTTDTTTTVTETLDAVEIALSSMRSKLTDLKQNVDDYSKSLKELEKTYQVTKRKYKKKVRNEKKEKFVKVSKELGKFMKLGTEGLTTRTQAMKYISNYVHEKKLQVEENKRNFRDG